MLKNPNKFKSQTIILSKREIGRKEEEVDLDLMNVVAEGIAIMKRRSIKSIIEAPLVLVKRETGRRNINMTMIGTIVITDIILKRKRAVSTTIDITDLLRFN